MKYNLSDYHNTKESRIMINCPFEITVTGPSSRSDRTPKLWLQIEENDRQLAAVFSSTYKLMPPDMRKCFLHMASFPEDFEIYASELIKLWVAKGFFYNVKMSIKA